MLTEEQKIEHRKQSKQKWRDKNPNYGKEYKQKNLERVKEMEKNWRDKHKEEKRVYDKMYREKNVDAIKERKRAYHLHRSYPHKRIYDDEIGIWECALCGAKEDEIQLEIHHKDQNRHNNNASNLVCLCKDCHRILHAKWNKEVIPQLINSNHVDWQGNIQS